MNSGFNHSKPALKRAVRYGARLFRRAFLSAAENLAGTITHAKTDNPIAALTFDDGPDPQYTPRLVEILERYDARGTFFMIGETAARHSEIVKRVAQGGHAIGNHSWDHPSFPLIGGRERRAQIRACAAALAPFDQKLLRTPYCDQDLATRFDAWLLGYAVIGYSVSTDDWCGGDADLIAQQLERQLRPGSVIVLHDRLFDVLEERYRSRDATLKAVEMTLQRFAGRYRFVTLPELLRHGRPAKELWYKKPDVKLLNALRREGGPGRRYPTSHAHAAVRAGLGS